VTGIKLTKEHMNLIAKAVAEPRRYEILRQIGSADRAAPCTDVRGCLPVSAATLSHHLKEFETAGVITVIRKGKFADLVLRREGRTKVFRGGSSFQRSSTAARLVP
jgi:DNA-binding transcriptional ArsR family regulator